MSLKLLSKKNPPVVRALYKLKHEIFKEGALDKREKELIAVAISSIQHCGKCLEFHTELAREAGATDEEIQEALSVAMYLTGPSTMIWSPKIDEAMGGPTLEDDED